MSTVLSSPAYAPGPIDIRTPTRHVFDRSATPVPIDAASGQELAAWFEAQRAEAFGTLAGAIPFSPLRTPPALWRVHERSEAVHGDGQTQAVPPRLHLGRPSISCPSAGGFIGAVDQALTRMHTSALRKVVLSRSLKVFPNTAPDPSVVVAALRERDKRSYTYAVPLPSAASQTRPSTLVGSSPELLVRRRGLLVESNPLAGSAPRSTDPREDHRRARALLASDKDRREHALVIESVATSLAPYCRELDVPTRPCVRSTPTMWHLSTPIRATLRDARTSATTLALALHPTPAICGTPTLLARDTITALEPFDRRYFCGLVGWTDPSGDGEWAVAIRCAELHPDVTQLYAGAGIVEGSVPEQELLETSAKLHTMLTALGLPLAVSKEAPLTEAAE